MRLGKAYEILYTTVEVKSIVGNDKHKKTATDSQHKAAVNLAREQVLQSFKNEPQNYTDVEASEPKAQAETSQPEVKEAPVVKENTEPKSQPNPYNRTLSSSPAAPTVNAKEWKKYHSAWQDYYRKYYEDYYVGAVQKTASQLAKQQSSVKAAKVVMPTAEDAETEKKETFDNLRDKINHRASTSARKFRKSRHFIPIISGLAVVLIFVFLQYNRIFFAFAAAYITPGNADSSIVEIDPTLSAAVGPEPLLIIPKINVKVPIIFGIGNDHASQQAGMERGVTHFSIPGANALPGQTGNLAIAGHSSNDVFDSGDFKFIFARLDSLVEGDTIFINFEGVRHTYVVTRKEVVLPTNVDSLLFPTDRPMLTLITCTPLGTARYRLLVIAEQISPDPEQAEPAPEQEVTDDTPVEMPSNSSTLFQRLIDWFTGLLSSD